MDVPADIAAAVVRLGLGVPEGGEPLTGGVSSDIWRLDLPGGPIVVKRALAKLRVAADWRAPVGRNRYEARWMRRAGAAVPGVVPELLGQDEAAGLLAMRYLAPADHALWKSELRDGRADAGFAGAVGARLARIHAVTAADSAVAGEFPTDDIFYDIRLEPYLVATAGRHPDRADALMRLVETTRTTKRALVHGDVSPKNILCGPEGPVFLDAECAWWGDPAFDAAFCLNHLLLKCLWNPPATGRFLACFAALSAAWLAGVGWEDRGGLEARVARLLPGLLLARVDGKSPAEYITEDSQRDVVRRVGRALLAAPVGRIGAVGEAWKEALPS